MRSSMSLEEFAALVRREPAEIGELAAAGLLDPSGEGAFDDLDLMRLMTVQHYGSIGYNPERVDQSLFGEEMQPVQGDEELWFCSEACLRHFLTADASAS